MKATMSSEYIKEMKANMKAANEAMKRISKAESTQDNAKKIAGITITQTENHNAQILSLCKQ